MLYRRDPSTGGRLPWTQFYVFHHHALARTVRNTEERMIVAHEHPRHTAAPTAGAPGVMLDRRRSDQHRSRHPLLFICVVSLLLWGALAFAVAKLHGQAATPALPTVSVSEI
jgi:hypothetical protein